MTVFAALAAFAGDATVTVPSRCIDALRLPGTSEPHHHASPGFGCASAPTRRGCAGIHAARDLIVAGDVRLDGRAELWRAIRSAGELSAVPDGEAAADDLALVACAYRAWGVRALERLRGDFALVLWDMARREFLGARDGLGVRPLYYANVGGAICVSNALDAVRACPGVSDSLHAPAIVSFLEHGVNRDLSTTTFAAVARLAPGTAIHATVTRPQPAVRTHWRMPDPEPLWYRRADEYVEQYRAILDAAVGDRIAGDTTILLSGGLDSTSIAATAARVTARGTTPPARLRALTFRTPAVESGEELRLATAVAAGIGMAHESRTLEFAPFTGNPRRTPEPLDEPEAATNEAIYAAISAHSAVVLGGEDGDGLFAPPSFDAMVRRSGVVATTVRVAMHTLRRGHHPYLGFWLRRRLRGLGRAPVHTRPVWLSASAGAASEESVLLPNGARPEAALRLGGAAWQAVHESVDRAVIGAPMEFRWPLLDSRLIEFVFAIPPVPWCQRKFLVRRAFAGELPAEVVNRPKASVPGYLDGLVAAWRARTGAVLAPLHERTREFVAESLLAETLRAGGTEDVLAAWRALALDRWFRQLEAA